MRLKLNLTHKVYLLVCVPIAYMLIFVTTLGFLQKRVEDAAWQEHHYKDVANECNNLISNFLSAGINIALYKSTSNKTFLDRFDESADAVPEQIRSLKFLLKDSPKPAESLAEIEAASNDALQALQRTRTVAGYNLKEDTFGAKEELLQTSSDFIKRLRRLIDEQRALEPINVAQEEQARHLISQCLTAGVVLSIMIAALGATLFNKSTSDRLMILLQNTVRLAANKELLPRLKGTDEIATLDNVFHEMAQSLIEGAQRKQELMQIVSHDLRTPLTSVRGSLDLLLSGRSGELPPSAMNLVTVADKNVEHLIKLINDLLDIEKVESGTLGLSKSQFVVAELFDRVRDAVEMFARQHNVGLYFRETDAIANADADRIAQVLINLISNAVKFSPAGSTVQISTRVLDRFIEFRVQDEGRGIAKEQLRRIFDRFHQVQQDDARAGKGTGLGLTISKAFVELHGGTIGAESDGKKGSTFWFRLPT